MNFCTLNGKVAEYSRICLCLGKKLKISSIICTKSWDRSLSAYTIKQDNKTCMEINGVIIWATSWIWKAQYWECIALHCSIIHWYTETTLCKQGISQALMYCCIKCGTMKTNFIGTNFWSIQTLPMRFVASGLFLMVFYSSRFYINWLFKTLWAGLLVELFKHSRN